MGNLDLYCKVLKWSGFSMFGFLFLLHLVYVPLEEIAGLLLPGSDYKVLGNYMLHYPNNIYFIFNHLSFRYSWQVVYACRMYFTFIILGIFELFSLASYEYNINTYFTSLLDVTGKQPVCYEYTFTVSINISKTIWVFAFLGSIVIGTCVDIEFFLLGSSALALWPLT